MYYIYHIPGIKIGCSKNPNRRVKQQGFTEFTIIEQHTDIDIASKRELELQKEYGYKMDNTLYKQTITSPTSEGRKKAGKILGEIGKKWYEDNPEHLKSIAKLGGLAVINNLIKKNIESGHISQLGKKMSDYNNRSQICPYCGIESRGIGYIRWHGENCKLK